MRSGRFPSHDGIGIAYEDHGDPDAPPIALVHGFASSLHANWRLPRWIDALTAAGRRVVGLDCRGHGRSDKPHDPRAYGGWAMPGDVVALLDHLGISRTDLMGYSMGGRIAMALLTEAPDRLERVVLAGVGGGVLAERQESQRAEAIASALEGDAPPPGSSPAARDFREFAERQGGDLLALAACMRGMRRHLDREALARVTNPVLVLVGRDDALVGDPRLLADAIRGARLAVIEGRDHLTAVPARASKEAVFDFLGFALPPRR